MSYRKQQQQKQQQKQKSKHTKRFLELTAKYLKIEEYLTIYDRKLFEMNYHSKYSGILLKIVFVTWNESLSMKAFLPHMHEVSLGKPILY